MSTAKFRRGIQNSNICIAVLSDNLLKKIIAGIWYVYIISGLCNCLVYN